MTQNSVDNPAHDGPLSTLARDGKRRWIHPVPSKGRYWKARATVAYGLIALFVGLPWIPIHGHPAIHLDLVARQFTFFGKTFHSTDTILLPFLAITGIVGIALFTAMFGRVWCGWGCPQTIYLEFVFRPIESLIDGPALLRSRRSNLEWSRGRILRTALKWTVYLGVAFVLAASFISYFSTPQVVWRAVLQPSVSLSSFVAVLFVTAMEFVDFAWFREQTCIIACPYGRIQAALTDAGSVIVAYDGTRGEPRGKLRKNLPEGEQKPGDCVDCLACVRSCPTGIDIRDGLQLECVGCTQCIDACDAVMDKLSRPRGLVRYTSLDQLEKKQTRILRPRVIVYGSIVLAAVIALVVLGSSRSTGFEFEVMRKPGAPFRVQSDGAIANNVRIRITNREARDQRLRLELPSPAGALLVTRDMPVTVDANDVIPIDAVIQTPRSLFRNGRVDARVRLAPEQGEAQERDFVLLGPEGNGP